MELSSLIYLYRNHFDKKIEKTEKIADSGSNRQYFRLYAEDGTTSIGVFGKDQCENEAFIYMSDVFQRKHLNVPKVFICDDSKQLYIQEDLGRDNLFSLLNSPESESLIQKTILSLADLQTIDNFDYSHCYPVEKFNSQSIMWDLNYFKYCFLKPTGIEFDETQLEKDFNALCNDLLSTPQNMWGFMYRDFQSRNVIIKDSNPWFIDYQGGRFGPMLYDVASFLWQAKAHFSPTLKEKMIDIYINRICQIRSGIDYHDMKQRLNLFVLFRTLQVLGAYGFRGLIEHKAHFISSISPALENLRTLVNEGTVDNYKYLKQVLSKLADIDRYDSHSVENKLVVSVFSFSYKKGYPDDFSGNGGGFMFDCRAMHNPGRYEEYKQLTGRDRPVIDFLLSKGEIQTFLSAAWTMTDSAVSRYLKRGFTSLQIGFGCTGGQHRSVYSAEETAKHIALKFPQAIVRLEHREQNIIEIFNNTI